MKDGMVDGPFKVWYENGKLKKKGEIINGKQNGDWEDYNEKGELIEKGTYRLGIKTKTENFN